LTTGQNRSFFRWYDTEHRHGSICMLPAYDVHYGQALEVLAQRHPIFDAARAAHLERFVRGIPKIRPLPEAVWINPPETSTTGGIAD
jgi:putative transposase